MGHAALYTMCRILQNCEYQQDTGLMRGAVFYINMGLWGHKRVQSLVCTETSVLPSLLQVHYSLTFSIYSVFTVFSCIPHFTFFAF